MKKLLTLLIYACLLLSHIPLSWAADKPSKTDKKNGPSENPSGFKPVRLTHHHPSRNGPDAIEAYRKGWNPLTAGPNYTPQADSLPEGEFNARFFMYGQFDQAQYTNSWGITGLPQGYSNIQLLDLFAMFYGIEPNTEFIFLPSILTTFSTGEGNIVDGTGLNDLSMAIKHRWVVQDPGSDRPSISTSLLVTLPTTAWTGTPLPPGNTLPPISVVPSTRLGTPSLTAILLTRKNVKPFRISGDLEYTFSFPDNGVLSGATQKTYNQFGDMVQERLSVEDVVDDRNGMGLILEFVGLSGLPFSLDGIGVNVHPSTFNLFGIQPAFEINLTERLAFSAGALLPVIGSNAYLATTPNFSLWYYWGSVGGHVLPR